VSQFEIYRFEIYAHYIITMTKEEKKYMLSMLNKALDGKGRVYVLRLEDDYYYVGWTEDLPHRLSVHFKGRGSAVTKAHKALEVIDVRPGNKATEKAIYEDYRARYGRKVRGSYDCGAYV